MVTLVKAEQDCLEELFKTYNVISRNLILVWICQECDCSEYSGTVGSDRRGRVDTAYRIVADHVRMMTFAISDGLIPSRRESG